MVGTCTAIEQVVTSAADDDVVLRVTGTDEVAHPGIDQVLDVAGHAIDGQRGTHDIRTGPRSLAQPIPGVIHHVGVVAEPPHQAVGTRTAIELVITGAADDDVVQRVTGTDEVTHPGIGQVFNVGTQRVASQAGLHQVDTAVERFDHRVADVVDHEGVVATTAVHGICAKPAIEDVVAKPAKQLIGTVQARDHVIACAPDQDIGAIGADQRQGWHCSSRRRGE
ncbi:hypothetical protein D3C72_997780 [compost metagenome]